MPAVAIAVAALGAGILVGAGGDDPERAVVERFLAHWARDDYAGMYGLLDRDSRRRVSRDEFVAAYRGATATATARGFDVRHIGAARDGVVPVELAVRTRVFGTVRETVRLRVSGRGEEAAIAWGPELVFPGLRPGERLTRETRLPPRAALLARDGTVLAEGPERTSPVPEIAAHVVGRLEPMAAEQRGALRALGYPDDARVGVTGLERVFERELAGRPGGVLRAGGRVLARTAPRPGRPVRTSIDPEIERAAVAALGDRYGGIAAVDPRTGEVLALAGVAYSALQPPGSTFKIVTLVGALEAGIARPSTRFPVETEATLAGVPIRNADGAACGGTLVVSFALSCNSVFAPLGADLGARRLVEVSERFGFNAPLGIPGAAISTIPPADRIGDELAVGASAIGQGRVQATTLQMALVAATIAADGRRPRPALEAGAPPRPVRVTSRAVARAAGRMMEAVVAEGTGRAAAIDGVAVAGKTGTAELRDAVPVDEGLAEEAQDAGPDTDAWFVAYAPARRPRIAVAVLLVEAGAGGDVAAPAAREVLAAAVREPAAERSGEGTSGTSG